MGEYLPGNLRERLRELREAHGYKTRQALAEVLGVNKSTYGRFESGKTKTVNSEMLIKLAKLYNVTTDYVQWKDPTGDLAVLHFMLEKLHNRLKLLPARKQRILMYHFGISSLEFKSVTETAAYFHLTEKYLKIIEAGALKTLRDGMNDGKII